MHKHNHTHTHTHNHTHTHGHNGAYTLEDLSTPRTSLSHPHLTLNCAPAPSLIANKVAEVVHARSQPQQQPQPQPQPQPIMQQQTQAQTQPQTQPQSQPKAKPEPPAADPYTDANFSLLFSPSRVPEQQLQLSQHHTQPQIPKPTPRTVPLSVDLPQSCVHASNAITTNPAWGYPATAQHSMFDVRGYVVTGRPHTSSPRFFTNPERESHMKESGRIDVFDDIQFRQHSETLSNHSWATVSEKYSIVRARETPPCELDKGPDKRKVVDRKRKNKKSKSGGPRKKSRKDLSDSDENPEESANDDSEELPFLDSTSFDTLFPPYWTGSLPASSEDLKYAETLISAAATAARPFVQKHFSLDQSSMKVTRLKHVEAEPVHTHQIDDRTLRKRIFGEIGWQTGDSLIPVRGSRTRAIAPLIVTSNSYPTEDDTRMSDKSGADEQFQKGHASAECIESSEVKKDDLIDQRAALDLLSTIKCDDELWFELLKSSTVDEEDFGISSASRGRPFLEVEAERKFVESVGKGFTNLPTIYASWSDLIHHYSDDFDGAYIGYSVSRLEPQSLEKEQGSYNTRSAHRPKTAGVLDARPPYPCPVAHHHPAAWCFRPPDVQPSFDVSKFHPAFVRTSCAEAKSSRKIPKKSKSRASSSSYTTTEPKKIPAPLDPISKAAQGQDDDEILRLTEGAFHSLMAIEALNYFRMYPAYNAALKEASASQLEVHAQNMQKCVVLSYGALSGMNFREIFQEDIDIEKLDGTGSKGTKTKNKQAKRTLDKVKKMVPLPNPYIRGPLHSKKHNPHVVKCFSKISTVQDSMETEQHTLNNAATPPNIPIRYGTRNSRGKERRGNATVGVCACGHVRFSTFIQQLKLGDIVGYSLDGSEDFVVLCICKEIFRESGKTRSILVYPLTFNFPLPSQLHKTHVVESTATPYLSNLENCDKHEFVVFVDEGRLVPPDPFLTSGPAWTVRLNEVLGEDMQIKLQKATNELTPACLNIWKVDNSLLHNLPVVPSKYDDSTKSIPKPSKPRNMKDTECLDVDVGEESTLHVEKKGAETSYNGFKNGQTLESNGLKRKLAAADGSHPLRALSDKLDVGRGLREQRPSSLQNGFSHISVISTSSAVKQSSPSSPLLNSDMSVMVAELQVGQLTSAGSGECKWTCGACDFANQSCNSVCEFCFETRSWSA